MKREKVYPITNKKDVIVNKMLPKLSDANFEIMQIVWKNGEVTVLDVMNELNDQRPNKLKQTSVQVMLTRLEKYGWVTHREEKRKFYYRALQKENTTVREILKDIKDRVFGGSDHDFLKFFFEMNNISSFELDRILTLLDFNDKG